MNNNEMRNISGEQKAKDKTAVLLYMLMRDYLPTSTVEIIVMEIENNSTSDMKFTNGWLGEYANCLSDRLK